MDNDGIQLGQRNVLVEERIMQHIFVILAYADGELVVGGAFVVGVIGQETEPAPDGHRARHTRVII